MVRVGDAAGVMLRAGVAGLLLAACGEPIPSRSVAPAPTEVAFQLRASAFWPRPPATRPPCGGVGLDAILRGNRSDPAVVWLQDRSTGRRIDVSWPAGFRAQFAPALVVIDREGQVILREGDVIDGACVERDGLVMNYP
jgi:hypothetical protein